MSNLKRYTLYILNAIDILAFILACFPAYFLAFSALFRAHSVYGTFHLDRYIQFLIYIILAYTVVNILSLYNDDGFMNRSILEELQECAKLTVFVIALVLMFFYVTKTGALYSRMFVAMYSGVFLCIDLLLRQFVKTKVLPGYQNRAGAEKLLVMADSHNIESLILDLKNSNDWRYQIVGAIVTDSDDKGAKILGIPVIADDADRVRDFLDVEYDSVLYDPGSSSSEQIRKNLNDFHAYGKTIHLKLYKYKLPGSFAVVDSMGDVSVMSYKPIQPMAKRKVLLQQGLEFILSIPLAVLLLVFMALAAVYNRLFARGPLFTRHPRIGKNGRRFYLFRFRTMHLDAEERILNGKSPDTGLGRLYRFLHIDGMPQILNVLSREMLFVGPKAPSAAEYLEMYPEERANYSVSPGIIGYWSIEEDPDEAARKFHNEINRRSLLKDALIIIVSIGRYLTGHSLRDRNTAYEFEAIRECTREKEDSLPLAYAKTGYRPKTNPLYIVLKRIIDIVLSLVGVIVLFPVMLVLTVMVIADDGGAPFYAHTRIGKDGRKIKVYKFRSMARNTEGFERYLTPEQLEQYRMEFKIDDDPRVTAIGSFLRRSSLDELPQLFNILGGSMSIVGPRPVTEQETVFYGDQLEKFLSMKPGLTGYWQAYARNNAVYETGQRQEMELYYVDHCSLLTDIRIFFRTFKTVLSGEGAQ